MAPSSSPDRPSTPPEELSLFRDIKEHPDDDTPRLIFADWLQEYGDAAASARGEYLRLRVLRDRLSPDDPNYDLLKRREGALFTEHCWMWLGPLQDAAKTWAFERGMIQITAQAEKVLTPEVTAWASTEAGLWLDALQLTDATPQHLSLLVDSPLLSQLNTLDLSGNRLGSGLRRLLRRTSIPFLSRLVLSRNRLGGTRAIAALNSCSCFPHLRTLELDDNNLRDFDVPRLTQLRHLPNLTILRLGSRRFLLGSRYFFSEASVEVLFEAFGKRVQFS